jgi:hypothetical protein
MLEGRLRQANPALPQRIGAGMAYDYVTVALDMNSLYDGTPDGSLRFEVSDFVMDTVTGQVVLVPPVHLAFKSGGQLIPVTFDLLAVDSNSLSTGWTWVMVAELTDRLLPIPMRSLTPKIANGAQQPFAALMAASTIVT